MDKEIQQLCIKMTVHVMSGPLVRITSSTRVHISLCRLGTKFSSFNVEALVSTKQDLIPLLLLMTGSTKASVQLSIYPPSRIQWNLAIILAQSEMCLYYTVGTQI